MPFKCCSLCNKCWEEFLDLVKDVSLHLNGYQAGFKNPDDGLIYLTHDTDGCHSTIAIRAADLRPLYKGPDIQVRNTGQSTCEGRCLKSDDFDVCNAECDLAWIRRALQSFRSHRVPDHLLPPPPVAQ